MRSHLNRFIRASIDWLFRRRSPALIVLRLGVLLLLAAVSAGIALSVSIPTAGGTWSFNIDTGSGTPLLIAYVATGVGVLLILIGVAWEWIRCREERRRLLRKKVIVIEGRGLRDASGNPLVNAVRSDLEGHREQVLLDVRQGIRDGAIVEPQAALEKILGLPTDLARRQYGLDRRDITIVYGGLMPVPLTFLTGVLVDDEQRIHVFDWDRHAERWRALDAPDDGKRFAATGIGDLPSNATEVVVVVSVSYRVDLDGARRFLPGLPIVHLELVDGNPDYHWSIDKQCALAKQFLETAIALGNCGVKRIHLFLAAQNSMVFRFGRLYDKRNLPDVIVYQYERGQEPPYTWGILMPVGKIEHASVFRL